jgi:hypothetical protein
MFGWLRNIFGSKTPNFKYTEGIDFELVADLEALKRDDTYPWSIKFKNRLIKVHSVRLPTAVSIDGKAHVDINAEVLQGAELNAHESAIFGELLMEIIQRTAIAKEK